jgi:hypothetical protein
VTILDGVKTPADIPRAPLWYLLAAMPALFVLYPLGFLAAVVWECLTIGWAGGWFVMRRIENRARPTPMDKADVERHAAEKRP